MTFTIEEDPVPNYTQGTVVNPTVTFVPPTADHAWDKIEPCNELNIQNNASGKTIVATKTTEQVAIIWSPDALAQFERELVIESLKSANGIGNPKGYLFLSGQGYAPEYGIEVNESLIKFVGSNAWSLIFLGTYERGSGSATATSITNIRRQREITVTKVWIDNDDQDRIRPDSITVHLLQNSSPYGTPLVLNAENGWTGSWSVPELDQNGNEISYHVAETVPDGYTCVVTGSVNNGFVLTNTHTPETTSVQAQKVWADDNNRDGIRPESVTIQLYKTVDGKKTAVGGAVVVDNDSSWTKQWHGLDKYANGQLIDYSVEETAVPEGYSVSYSTDETGRLVVTNTHETEKTSITVTKAWNDNDNQDNIRPDSVMLTLYANGIATTRTVEVSPNADGVWSATFTDLPKNANGRPIVYSVSEEESNIPEGYTVTASGTAQNGYTVTNSHTPETTEITVTKAWDDGNNQDGIRPGSITAAVYAGEEEVATVEVSAANNWRATVTGLPKYADGEEIVYTVKETEVPAGYTSSVEGTAITNKHIPEVAQLNVEKVWNDFGDNDGKRPEGVIITLYANGEPTEYTLTLNEGNGWKGSWADMPRYHEGQRISYSVVETGYIKDGKSYEGHPDGYTVTHSYDTANTASPKAIVTNTYTPESVGLNVQKVWQDADNQDGIRPASVTVELYQKLSADGEPTATGKTAVLSAGNEWDADFTGLPRYHDGYEIEYSVVETPVEGYEAPKYAVNKATGVVTVTNTHVPEKTEVTVSKEWDDGENQDGIRPAGVTVELYANGVPTGKTAVLSESNGWKAEFKDLNKYFHGKEIAYAVVETAVEGYAASYRVVADDENGTTDITVTNTHSTDLVSIPVEKIWVDADDQDGKRPDSITVTLYADGEATNTTLSLSAGNNWMGIFSGLPVNKDGKEIVYSIVEAAIDGYNTDENGNAQPMTAEVVNGKITITNTLETERTTLTVIKVWDDNGDRDGKRPDSITLHLLANGVHMGETYKAVLTAEDVDANGNWTYTWKNLDKYSSGQLIRYTVYEEPVYFKTTQSADQTSAIAPQAVNAYTASYVRDSETQITVTNSYVPETTVITAMKIWDDGDNRDALRPENITVELYRMDGENQVKVESAEAMTLSEKNDWVASWTDLPKYEDHGVEIVYTVVENNVPDGYECTIVREEKYAPGLFVITNTHVPAITGVTVGKIWNDENNNDGKRPDGIIVQLCANGSAIEGSKIQLSESNAWSYTWESTVDMPLYVYDQGEVIDYYVLEVGYVIDGVEYEGLPDGYEGSTAVGDNAYTVSITNTRTTEKISVSVVKAWDDGDDNDGIRPDSVEVTLNKNGAAVETVILNDGNQWSYTWTNLYKYANGEEVAYSVVETAVEGYTATYSAVKDADHIVLTVTNTHDTQTTELTITKVWKDNNDEEGLRPNTVIVQLYKNGTAYGDIIRLSSANNWKYTVELPVYENGEKITWTVKETDIPRYYTVSYNQDTLTITNTIQSKDVPKSGDYSNLWLWILIMGGCTAGAATVVLYDRKKKHAR